MRIKDLIVCHYMYHKKNHLNMFYIKVNIYYRITPKHSNNIKLRKLNIILMLYIMYILNYKPYNLGSYQLDNILQYINSKVKYNIY